MEESEDSENSIWRPLLEAVMPRILRDYKSHEVKVYNGMESGMRKLFEKPYEQEIKVLHGRNAPSITVEDARRVLFFPRLTDMRIYVKSFERDTPEATARRERVLKFKMMSVFYTLHRKDGALMDRFMHCGGLASLVTLLGEDQNIIQSQAMELLIEMLSPLIMTQAASTSRQAHLHHQVFVCFRSESFWRNLARIVAESAEVFPDSHNNSVKALAGAVGWLRPEEGVLPEEGAIAGMEEVATALQSFLDSRVPAKPDVRYLAEELMAELSNAPTIRSDPLRGVELEAACRELFAPDAEANEDAAHAWQCLRLLGNEAFGAGLIWPAVAAYRMALTEGGDTLPDAEASLIDSNRALALIRAGHHAQAAEAAARALEYDPHNAKAAYRRAQALLEQPGASVSIIQDAVVAAEIAARLEPMDAKVKDLLAMAKVRFAETCPGEDVAAQGPAQCLLDSMD